ncbi:MAG: response regulator transcription factor [bacterium]|jgi:DNA-binding response OmpR family regulator
MEITHNALLVEDDIDICELVRIILRAENFALELAHDGRTGLELAQSKSYNLIILDLMLPQLDGWEICRQLRQNPETRSVPIIMLTAKGEEKDKVLGLELGADDYITKPFRPREFLARVKALMRRTTDYNQPDATLQFGELIIQPRSYLVLFRDQQVDFSPREFELLVILATNLGRPFNREQLLEKVWGYAYFGGTRTIDEHVKRIRQKLSLVDPGHTYIQTVWGVGYKFEVKQNVS